MHKFRLIFLTTFFETITLYKHLKHDEEEPLISPIPMHSVSLSYAFNVKI